jgi:lysine-ketoglutarate reductase/saccharopine dehydrogenase-like protein (TIGR00300 family)
MERIATVRAEGHLIDSGTLSGIFDHIIRCGAEYEVTEFRIGRTNEDVSVATLRITAATADEMGELLENLIPLGAFLVDRVDARTEIAPLDGVVPDDFYSTTNHHTEVRLEGRWIEVERQRMDSVIVVTEDTARCTKLRDVCHGDRIVVGAEGIRVSPPDKERDRAHFGFMTNEVSSEKQVELAVARIVQDIRAARRDGGRVVVVAGPIVVHTGGVEPLEKLLADGWVDVLLTGNALAVHDIERALYDTSLGIHRESGDAVVDGHRNHMRAINTVRRAGSIARAVETGVLRRGIMHRCVTAGVPYVLAGSLRDDGPLPEVITDMNLAQEAYAEAIEGARVVLILSTMLHGIAVGNMLSSTALTVCVDINPAVVTKLADRGSSQAIGIVTDVGLFLSLLGARLGAAASP